MKIPWTSHEHPIKIPWKSHEHPIKNVTYDHVICPRRIHPGLRLAHRRGLAGAAGAKTVAAAGEGLEVGGATRTGGEAFRKQSESESQ